jgi:hypothetical protein
MRRSARVVLPYVVAFALPAIVLGALFAASGDTPLYGLFGGGVGLTGALAALATRLMLAPKMTESEIEALARELDEQEAWPIDARREREFTELVQLGQEQERDEPPERV